jgi:hypothetical protein
MIDRAKRRARSMLRNALQVLDAQRRRQQPRGKSDHNSSAALPNKRSNSCVELFIIIEPRCSKKGPIQGQIIFDYATLPTASVVGHSSSRMRA